MDLLSKWRGDMLSRTNTLNKNAIILGQLIVQEIRSCAVEAAMLQPTFTANVKYPIGHSTRWNVTGRASNCSIPK